jgi:hypothetical protein
VEAPPVVATTPIYVHPHARSPEPKLVPIHTWGVSFNGEENGMTVNQFLERVEELSVARNATNRDLFNAAIDLFSGKALIWYRSVRERKLKRTRGFRFELHYSWWKRSRFNSFSRRWKNFPISAKNHQNCRRKTTSGNQSYRTRSSVRLRREPSKRRQRSAF